MLHLSDGVQIHEKRPKNRGDRFDFGLKAKSCIKHHSEGAGMARRRPPRGSCYRNSNLGLGSPLPARGIGIVMGSVSGGCVEAAVVAETVNVLSSGMPKTLQFGLEHGTAWKVGLVCGGTIRIFVEPLEERGRAGAGVLQRLASDIEARREVAPVTELATGTRS